MKIESVQTRRPGNSNLMITPIGCGSCLPVLAAIKSHEGKRCDPAPMT
jgi:hypothetical protein